MTSNNLTFRLATAEDAVELEQLINTSFRNDPTTDVFLSADHAGVDVIDAASIASSVSRPDLAVFAGIDADGRIVAHFSVRKLDEERAWLGLLAVDVSRQERGLGGQALAHAERYARAHFGARRLEFSVVCTRAKLIAWYAGRGYRLTGETSAFPYEAHPGWETVLRGDLSFVVLGKELVGEGAADGAVGRADDVNSHPK